ncbi:catalase/peroxidase HPI [Pseudonocardia halophobica]|uniref:Catalase-peroxidase n=1 Tax=Pseudonocardia halophobica TaxID=29401 RepID=A0A9W6KVY6_9PSEU|nr:catalase/peroxidase HPI [Pseudonocardia halophobica]GLL09031.1 catalase-peroxidase [Pseudonocardia halophobica]
MTDPKPRDDSASPQGTDTTASRSESENPALAGPTAHVDQRPRSNRDWWPNQVDLSVLTRTSRESDPLGDDDFDYKKAVSQLDFEAVKADIVQVMRTSQDWWPADWGHYGPLFIRMSWHAAGTYRQHDGRGGGGEGAQRFAPLNSWPDNGNLDKARRLLLPVKQKYGRSLSWADLLVLAGNVAHEDMGFETFGFAFGRPDVWQPDEVFWGPEDTWLGDERYSGDAPLELEGALGAVTMGLIYVNPEGAKGEADPLATAHDIRVTFGRMAMNDEETVALIAGGHTFGKAHGAGNPDLVGPEPEGCPVFSGGLGWKNQNGTGKGADTVTSGLEGAWTPNPTQWDNGYWDMLFGFEWELTQSPAGAKQWKPKEAEGQELVPDAHIEGKKNPPMMATSDLSLLADPEYRKISERFRDNPEEFAEAYRRAWFKLLHRDMGPVSRYVGPWVPSEVQLWQDPIPAVEHELLSDSDAAELKKQILASGLTVSQLVHTAWSSAASFRTTDKRGGANGARLRLEPQASWPVNAGTAEVIAKLDEVRQAFGKPVSLADTIVLAGAAAVEKAAADAGVTVTVPFAPGRTDASQEQTDVDTFQYLEPRADGFRNWISPDVKLEPETLLVDRAYNLELSAKDLTVLIGGLRVLAANTGGTQHGVFTDRPGVLSQDFFRNLLDLGVEWSTSKDAEGVYEARDAQGNVVRTATAVDLVFGSNSILRGIVEVYGADDAKEKFVRDFVKAWDKVMNLDRFDLR